MHRAGDGIASSPGAHKRACGRDEHERRSGPFVGEVVPVAAADALDQAVRFHLAQIVAELGEVVDAVAEAEGGQDGLMDVGGPPAVELRAAV